TIRLEDPREQAPHCLEIYDGQVSGMTHSLEREGLPSHPTWQGVHGVKRAAHAGCETLGNEAKLDVWPTTQHSEPLRLSARRLDPENTTLPTSAAVPLARGVAAGLAPGVWRASVVSAAAARRQRRARAVESADNLVKRLVKANRVLQEQLEELQAVVGDDSELSARLLLVVPMLAAATTGRVASKLQIARRNTA
ncbi:unnamed protein product, partial [Prorocentrum cordatum]